MAHQQERPNVEQSDLTVLVIRALGLILGHTIKTELVISDVNTVSDVYRKRHFLLTTTITSASQALITALELDINSDYVTTRKIGRVLGKMRMNKERQKGTGKNGWLVSLADVDRWITSYGLERSVIAGIKIISHQDNITERFNITNHKRASLLEGKL
jgi:hypothetical protein